MNKKEFLEYAEKFDKTTLKEVESLFKKEIEKYIDHVDSQPISEKEKLSKLLTFTYKEAYKASFMASVAMNYGITEESE